MVYTVPSALITTYALVQARFLFGVYLFTYLFVIPYTVPIMALSVLLADYRFFIDFGYLVSQHEDMLDDE
jgi:hypothetical protein